jgi:protein-S-isoprenylcysteine O-methyltransferase
VNFDAAQVMGVIYGISEFGLSLRRRAASGDSRLEDKGSLWLLWSVIGLSVFMAYNLYFIVPAASFGDAAAPAACYAGIAVYVLGLSLRWYAIVYLGRFFTVNVAIAADHQLIDGGPYRYVRHPSYTGALMAFLGLGLALANWASLAILLIPISLAFARRMRIEEAALLQGLGAPYRLYMDRTKRLIPGVY